MDKYFDYYTPDKWMIIKINGKNPHYRVFGSWYGGYLDGDSWRMNSGIKKVSHDGDFYLFEGYTGSIYKCHKNSYGASIYSIGILNNMISTQPEFGIEILPEDVKITELEFK